MLTLWLLIALFALRIGTTNRTTDNQRVKTVMTTDTQGVEQDFVSYGKASSYG